MLEFASGLDCPHLMHSVMEHISKGVFKSLDDIYTRGLLFSNRNALSQTFYFQFLACSSLVDIPHIICGRLEM